MYICLTKVKNSEFRRTNDCDNLPHSQCQRDRAKLSPTLRAELNKFYLF